MNYRYEFADATTKDKPANPTQS
ncbi:hypothetical protein PSAB6_70220 [Paraburkholderia sabiae]|nr:hypothetical protein PSAB6_70220 [Paraburkholderia sabiae]